MISKLITGNKALWFILIAAFLIRLYNFSFPFFTADEARVAFRGYTLATTGKDELGRSFPLIFNSLEDYQLPAVSYVTAVGIRLFGKNDAGARMPFVFISLAIVILVYKSSRIFNLKREFQLLSAFIVAFSPSLIFLSKIPNETILLILSFTLLFYLLTKEKMSLLSLVAVMAASLTVSKVAWWTMVPFVLFNLTFIQNNLQKKTKIKIISISLLLMIIALVLFLRVPQSTRSLIENDFPIVGDTSINVAVNKLRGQGLEAGWPNYIERIIFNKLQFINVGLINWFDHLSPAILFSRFDLNGTHGFANMGEFPAVTIIPFATGLVFIVSRGDRKLKTLVYYLFILTFPIFFSFPGDWQSINLIILPFIAIIISVGLVGGSRLLKYTVLFFMILEIIANTIYFSPEVKNANSERPVWLKQIVETSSYLSVNNRVAISDNLVSDIAPFLEWLSPVSIGENYKNVGFPYKFRQTSLTNIRIIRTEDIFYFCSLDAPTYIVASKRDLEKIQKWLNIDTSKTAQKTYQDSLGKEIAYLFELTICVH